MKASMEESPGLPGVAAGVLHSRRSILVTGLPERLRKPAACRRRRWIEDERLGEPADSRLRRARLELEQSKIRVRSGIPRGKRQRSFEGRTRGIGSMKPGGRSAKDRVEPAVVRVVADALPREPLSLVQTPFEEGCRRHEVRSARALRPTPLDAVRKRTKVLDITSVGKNRGRLFERARIVRIRLERPCKLAERALGVAARREQARQAYPYSNPRGVAGSLRLQERHGLVLPTAS